MKRVFAFFVCLVVNKFLFATEILFGHEDDSSNLLSGLNGDCENDISSGDAWRTKDSTVSQFTTDSYTGSASFKISDRTNRDGGAYLYLDGSMLKPNTPYYLSMFVKQITERADGGMYSYIRVIGRYRLNGITTNFNMGRIPYMHVDDDWKQLGSDFVTPKEVAENFIFSLRCEPIDIEYLIDTAALTEIPAIPDLVADTDAKIEQIRKGDVTVSGSVDAGQEIWVNLTHHQFKFGTALKEWGITGTDESARNYQEFVYKWFNGCVLENAMKWTPMEKWEGHVNFDEVDAALDELMKHGLKCRGHALTWDIYDTNPPWVRPLSGDELEDAIFRRLDYCVEHFKGRITEWDVCNEYLHQRFFELRTSLYDVIDAQFKEVAKIDPDVGLCLNDYEQARNGEYTSASADLARYMINKRNLTVDCIGVQSHLREPELITPERLRKRLQIVGSAGVKIVITEFSAHSYDINERARLVEQAFRIYFADSNINGLFLWGFNDKYTGFADDMYLTNGVENTPNLAGQKMIDLFLAWRTNEKVPNNGGIVSHEFRAFFGEYDVTIINADGSIARTSKFTVTEDGPNVISI